MSASGNFHSYFRLKRRYSSPMGSEYNVFLQVEFRVNGEKVDFPMKLGEGGEAFFVFQTEGDIPEYMQTSPIVSPYQSPVLPDVLGSVNPPGKGVLMVGIGNGSSGTGLS